MSELYSLHTCTLQAPGEALYAVLADTIEGLSKQKARQAVIAGLVSIDDAIASSPTLKLDDKTVTIQLDLRQGFKKGTQQQSKHAFSILYEDNDVVVVDKAAGILSAPSQRDDHGHIPELLRNFWRKQKIQVPYIGVVHRIDQATSGCLLLAKNKSAQNILSQQFKSHAAERLYRCLCLGQPRKMQDTLNSKIGRGNDGYRRTVNDDELGKDATTHFTVLQRIGKRFSELSLALETGRTHQIRVHLAGIGCPILGDEVYIKRAQKSGQLKGVPQAPRLMLHAYQIVFDHPRTGERISVDAPMHKVFEKYVKQLERVS